ncbi:IS30 family transposase [Adlercreutzia sp. ZJ473]|uniref:IS30 family transposase n=1 Tax=Adlercreutzia sp. ZJ473 TaxID=2722822 RepID=UPI0015578A06|nr:IS30 family transposase [Adlercreutzia sp. ZJ473]
MTSMASKGYDRLTKADRRAIEAGVRARKGCREIAASIGRSPSTVTEEVRRNRTWAHKDCKGMRAVTIPEQQRRCERLVRWPWVCNGCFTFPRACGRRHRCEYSAIFAQALADETLSSSRRGINAREEDFERIAFTTRDDVSRGMSPEQICMAHPHLGLAPSTLYRWIERGYLGMSNLDLRRKVGYKPRKGQGAPKPTSHGPERSYAAFCALGEEACGRACEMDTVMGRASDTRCLLTLLLRPCRLQLTMLLEEKSSSEVVRALDALERALGRTVFSRLFDPILTDNGPEFADTEGMERSLSEGARTHVFYCDVRASQQKGRCERNHVELRKLLPKGRGIVFDELDRADCAVVMSHLNSEPRPSLLGMSPLSMLRAADPEAHEALCCALGMAELPYGEVGMTLDAVNREREARGARPLG